ncbi:MAG: hypothetical protein QXV69_01350 [Sulfolobaceae archaeon]
MPKKKGERVLIAIREDLVEEINNIANKHGRNYRDIIEMILEQFIKTYQLLNKIENFHLYFIVSYAFLNSGFGFYHPALGSSYIDGNYSNLGRILGKHFLSIGVFSKELIEIILKFLLPPNPNIVVEENSNEIILRLNSVIVSRPENLIMAKNIINGIMEVNGYKLVKENLENIGAQFFTGEIRYVKRE